MTAWILVGLTLAGGCGRDGGRARSVASATPGVAAAGTPTHGRIAVTVDGQGYHPSTIRASAGRPVTLVFTRTTDATCGTEVVFPALNLRRALPLDQPVEVAVTPAGTLAFTCGMNMLRGEIIAQ